MRQHYEGNVFSPMGCRSFLSPWKDSNGQYKFEGRFNQGVVSLNLPQIGIVANGDEKRFWMQIPLITIPVSLIPESQIDPLPALRHLYTLFSCLLLLLFQYYKRNRTCLIMTNRYMGFADIQTLCFFQSSV